LFWTGLEFHLDSKMNGLVCK